MTSKEAEEKYNINIPNKKFFETLTEQEQIEIIKMRLNYHNQILEVFKELKNDK